MKVYSESIFDKIGTGISNFLEKFNEFGQYSEVAGNEEANCENLRHWMETHDSSKYVDESTYLRYLYLEEKYNKCIITNNVNSRSVENNSQISKKLESKLL